MHVLGVAGCIQHWIAECFGVAGYLQHHIPVGFPNSRGKIQFNPPKIVTKGFSTDFGSFEYTF